MENKQTHVGVDSSFTTPTGAVENVFGDNIAYVKHFDFSRANLNQENRIAAISQIASVCYQNPKALGSISLYDRLACESHGLPSSSFEFVPVLFRYDFIETFFCNCSDIWLENSNTLKYGERFEYDDVTYLLTNYRALIYDVENAGLSKSILDHFNTEEECKIIAKHFNVFQVKIDMPTRSQYVRHRINLQELSRRYVSGKRVEFDFYISEKMSKVYSSQNRGIIDEEFSTDRVINVCLNHYFKALEDGVKPEEARRIIPQACYTQIWGGFQPTQLENFFKLRLDSHSQWEIRKVAEAMKSLVENNNG